VIAVSRGTGGGGEAQATVGGEDIEGVSWGLARCPVSSLVASCGGTGVADRGVWGGERLTILIVVTACLYNWMRARQVLEKD
jgi:hypothetical protein